VKGPPLSEFIELVRNLSWPVVILGIGTLYRVELKESLGRIVSMRYRNIELNFGADLRAATALVAATQPTTATASVPPAPGAGSPTVLKELDTGPARPGKAADAARLGRLAEVSPRAAISEAWHEVEVAATAAVRSMGLPDHLGGLGELVARGLLPAQTEALTHRLKELRDRVRAEGPMLDAYLLPEQALRFAELARGLAAQLDSFTNAG